ncbi:hypothetical protein PHLCEN_2v10063 [Hermanssonia centrifuga]|uniref:Methyltransferase type 11 domain-containing protein n=1 Tax=Hermanssonia centrifuga TaxID=98765 RepID=A0A2R6NNV3_9APHY|nr:hypothetical protein PHLCEN_2v10063 [Hermanssonia centrifuga]
MSTSIHEVAKLGFGAGTNELYDRIGAGTGIFTRALLAHPDWSGSIKQLRAIEPVEGMREQFSKTVIDDRVTIAEGAFDRTGVEDGWADLVVIAQAFHWCPDYEKAVREFYRVLKPNGVAVLIWNLEDRDAAKWVAQLRDRVEQHEKGTPQFRLGLWRATFGTPSYPELFAPQEETTWAYPLLGTKEIVVDRACSKSYIAVLPADEKQSVIADVKAIVEKGDSLVYTDKEKGEFEYPYKTTVVVMRKK